MIDPDLPPWAAPRHQALAAPVELARVFASRRAGIASIRERQLAVIRSLVRHAAATVPVYLDLYPPDLAGELQTIEDVGRIPTVDKQAFLARPIEERRSSQIYEGEGSVSTSGSTGQPFLVFKTPYARYQNWLHSMLMMRAMEIGFRDSQASMGSRPMTHRPHPLAGRRHRLKPTLPPARMADSLAEIRPDWITGHPHQLVEIGWHLDGRIRPRTVTTFGVTTGPDERAAIEELYGTAPIDIFGTAESSFFAWQCRERDLYHVAPELVYLEAVDDQGQPVPGGELGHLVLTPLVNIAMPFIRYRMGDSIVMATRPCGCGYRLPCIEKIQGRTFDWVVNSRGDRVPPQRLQAGWVMEEKLTGIRRYKVHQRADGSVEISLVLAGDPQFDPERWRTRYEGILDQTVEVTVVDNIPLDPSGKFRQFTSDVAAAPLAHNP